MATAGTILAVIIAVMGQARCRAEIQFSMKRRLTAVSQGLYVVTNCVADLVLMWSLILLVQIFRCYVVWDYRKVVLIIATVISIMNNIVAFVIWGLSMRFDLYQVDLYQVNDFERGTVIYSVIFLSINFVVNLILSLMIGRILEAQNVAKKMLGAKLQRAYGSALSIM
ncbi:hypothetical protein K435DRAFT_804333 [Dendrothele bispora CBS 962.96]|uniref:Uncharacterized protein n=1 Tax=Dendrothele bispora (strain CBS 962.96) TaxID=1314807 RepID=A0A4S8LEL9_DENBC|nr:hypothetical protein K435DRAFT_804333 [Dendrothele bispora CBS 962.96]